MMKKRILSIIIMVLSMCLSMLPTAAFAAEDTGLCEHHPEHTAECGYAEAVAGVDCTHQHTADCYTNGVLPESDADSSNAYELEGDTEQTNTLLCTHTHDEGCGYVEAVEASPCTYVCPICAVQELIDALPDEVTADNADLVAAQLDAIDHGKSQLTTEELTLLDLTKYTAAAQAMGALAAVEVACTCETDDPAWHAPFCALFVPSAEPECFCADKCVDDEDSKWCEVCWFDIAACTGEDTAAAYSGSVTVDSTNKVIYANGVAITIADNGTTATITETNGGAVVHTGSLARWTIYGGGESGEVASTSITIEGTFTDASSPATIYGGGSGGSVTGQATITVASGATLGWATVPANTDPADDLGESFRIFGGGQTGAVGSASVTVSGTVHGYVFGGGENADATVGSTSVSISGTVGDVGRENTAEADFDVGGVVCGGGLLGNVTGAATVNVTGTVDNVVYGGGCGHATNHPATGSTIVTFSGTINDDAGGVYGGGNYGSVTGQAAVTISGGTPKRVTGGGAESGATTGSVSITVTGGDLESVRGTRGGNVTGNVTIDFKGGTIDVTGSIGGGSSSSSGGTVSGSATVNISGGTVAYVHGDDTGTVTGTAAVNITGGYVSANASAESLVILGGLVTVNHANFVTTDGSKNGTAVIYVSNGEAMWNENWTGMVGINSGEFIVKGTAVATEEVHRLPDGVRRLNISIESGSTLNIEDGVTLVSRGVVTNNGSITGPGRLLLRGGEEPMGSLAGSGTVDEDVVLYGVEVVPAGDSGNYLTVTWPEDSNTAVYTDSYGSYRYIVENTKAVTIAITPAEGYKVGSGYPNVIRNDGGTSTTLTKNTNYTYINTSGLLTLKADAITNPVRVEVNAVSNRTTMGFYTGGEDGKPWTGTTPITELYIPVFVDETVSEIGVRFAGENETAGTLEITENDVFSMERWLWNTSNSNGRQASDHETSISKRETTTQEYNYFKLTLKDGTTPNPGTYTATVTLMFDENWAGYHPYFEPVSLPVTLVVSNGVKFTTQPEDHELSAGYAEAPTLSVAAEAASGVTGEVSYQWYTGEPDEDGKPVDANKIDGATSASYTLQTDLDGGDHKYYCVATAGSYSTASRTATVTVHAHDWSYELNAAGDTITASCGCGMGGTVTIIVPSDLIYNGSPIVATATSSNEDELAAPTITYIATNGGTLTNDKPVNAGTYTASITMGDKTAQVTYTIKTAELTVTGATATGREYNGTSTVTITDVTLDGILNSDAVSVDTTNLTGTLSGDNAGDYTSVTLPALTLTGTAAGNYTLTQPEGAVTTTVTISPKSISGADITLGDSLTYTGGEQTQTISSVTVDGLPLTENTDYTVIGNTGTDATNYTLTITGKDNYTNTATKEFSIGKANASVTTAPTAINPTYNGTAQALINAGSAIGGTMEYVLGTDAITAPTDGWTTTVPTGTAAGDYTVYYKVVGDTNHNDSEAASVTVTIAPAPLTISGATLAEKTYNGDGTATVTGIAFGGVQNNETLTIGENGDYTATAEFTDPNAGDGTKTADVTVTLTNSNYSLADNTLELSGQTIKQATAPTMTATATMVRNQPSYTVRLDLTTATGYPATPGGTPTFAVQTGSYNGLTSATLDADGETLVLVADNTQNSTADTVAVNVTGMGNYENGTITVTVSYTDKTPVTISGVTAQNGTYNGSAQQGYTGTPSSAYTGTYEITYTGRDGTSYSSNAAPTNAGDYTVTFKVPDSNQTYTGSTSLNFSITKKKITVPTQPAAVTYNGGAQTYGVTATSDYTVSGGIQTNANETGYDVTIALTDTANTEWASGGIGSLTQKFIINRAALTVTADNKSAIVGAARPALTYTVSGLQGTDQLTTAPSLSCTPNMDAAGEYEITIGGAAQSSGNYTISHVNGKLTVSNKTTPSLTLTPSSASLSGGGAVTLTVGGLPTGGNVTITCDNTTYNPTGSGTTWSVTLPNTTAAYVFTANFAGDDAHNSATATCTVNVTYKSSGGGGGGPSTPSTPPTTSVTVPISGDDNTIHVGASVTGDKATVNEVDLSKLDTVIGDDVSTGTVTIDFSRLNSSKDITTVEIPSDVVKQIAEAVNNPVNDAESLEIVFTDGTSIEFDAVALGEKAAQADGLDVTISIQHAKDAKPTAAQQGAIGDRPAFDITVTSGGKPISEMGGRITVHAPYELRPGEKPRGIVVWYVDENGSRERCETSYDSVRQRVNWKTSHLSVYMIDYDEALAEICDGGEGCPSAKFIDVDPNAWYHEAIDYAIENGLMGGYGNGYFGLNDDLSRGMLAQILYNLEGRPAVSGDMPFTDVTADRYYFDAILWAQRSNIVGGYGGGLFGPDDPITREQLAVMLWRYAGSPAATDKELNFTDADEVGTWAVDALIWAQENGVMQGNNNAVNPKGNASRSHVAQMLKNFIENILK